MLHDAVMPEAITKDADEVTVLTISEAEQYCDVKVIALKVTLAEGSATR